MPRFELIATATFGLENVVARELEQLGYENLRISDGRVLFSGDERDIARCNIWLRSADRILIRVGEFPAPDFGALFDQIVELPWADLLPVDAQFPVKGRSVRSRLHAVPKIQGVTKKAIVESLKKKHNRFRFDESGAEFVIEVALLKDIATLTIDTTGVGLHKRGYRQFAGAAPLRETMAAGLIQLSYWNPERPLIDPFCGSGTIPIEAAMIGRNIAPGLQRSFAAEDWPWFDRAIWKDVRAEARDVKKRDLPAPIMAYDHDPDALRHSRRCATDAGVGGSIRFNCQEVSDLRSTMEYGCLITNPPYGERLGDSEEVEAVYRIMGKTFATMDTWSVYVLTSYRGFEHHFGRRADRRRKLYNGRLECQYYQYQGPRPPRDDDEEIELNQVTEIAEPDSTPPPAQSAQIAQAINPFETFVAECQTPAQLSQEQTDTRHAD
jgi:putative N6-adenine-specific DNA methylase